MIPTEIKDHQDLLELYYSAERGHISEYSGWVSKDTEELNRLARGYAEANGLNTDFIEVAYDGLISP